MVGRGMTSVMKRNFCRLKRYLHKTYTLAFATAFTNKHIFRHFKIAVQLLLYFPGRWPVPGRRFRPARSKLANKILRTVTTPGSLTQKDLHQDQQLFLKFRYESVIKKINLVRPWYKLHIYPMKSKRIPKSRETIPLRGQK
jgi:hypothetical protein